MHCLVHSVHEMHKYLYVYIFPVQLENVCWIVIYLLTMAIHEHYIIIQGLDSILVESEMADNKDRWGKT